MNLGPASREANGAGVVYTLDDALETLCRVPTPVKCQFEAFRRFYDEVCPEAHFRPIGDGETVIPIDGVSLSTHASVVQAVTRLRSYGKTAALFRTEAFPHCKPLARHQVDPVRQTVQLAYMIDPASQDDYPSGFRFGSEPDFPVKWQPEQNFRDFVKSTFPTSAGESWALDKRDSLNAWELRQRLKIRIVPTNDLAEHLVYNPSTRALAVFHQVEWLKAQVRYTKDRELDEVIDASLANGTLPPQLLTETLYTIYKILFPIGTNQEAFRFAEQLMRADGSAGGAPDCEFDHNLLIDDGLAREVPADSKCVYWSRRLEALHAVVKARPPKNKIVSWFERHTSERNALTVAVIGLFLSALFGFLGLLVGIAQLVISVLAWKYPAQSAAD